MNAVERHYATLSQLASELNIPISTLRVKICLARRRGLEPPPRRRVGRSFIYDSRAFAAWLWDNAAALKREFKFGGKGADDESDAE